MAPIVRLKAPVPYMQTVELVLMSDGWCEQLEALARTGGRWRKVRFRSLFALIRHPTAGPILFDTGYGRFLAATAKFPWLLYRMVTPVHIEPGQDAAAQLGRHGLKPADVRHVILSHLHADHIGAAADFPQARFHTARTGWQAVAGRSALGCLHRAFVPSLLPADFVERTLWLEQNTRVQLGPEWAPFTEAQDVLGDGSLLAVPLPGHAEGQHGLLCQTAEGPVFLVADGSWSSQAIRANQPPHLLTGLIQNLDLCRITLARLHELARRRPDLRMVVAHCPEMWTPLNSAPRR